jgi:hypothetical protein
MKLEIGKRYCNKITFGTKTILFFNDEVVFYQSGDPVLRRL